MPGKLTNTELEAALEDLESRTLARIGSPFGRLVYLASTRDYNTGRYYHDGLAFQFSDEIASKALATAHRELFLELALRPLQDLTNELHLYLQSIGGDLGDTIQSWERLEPYRVVVPIDADRLTAGLFLGNVRLALAIVKAHLPAAPRR